MLRAAAAVAIYWLKSLEGVPDVLAIVGAVIAMCWAAKGLFDWIRTADWAHDAELTRQGNERAHLDRAEARRMSERIRAEKRLAKQRRRRSA